MELTLALTDAICVLIIFIASLCCVQSRVFRPMYLLHRHNGCDLAGDPLALVPHAKHCNVIPSVRTFSRFQPSQYSINARHTVRHVASVVGPPIASICITDKSISLILVAYALEHVWSLDVANNVLRRYRIRLLMQHSQYISIRITS